MVNELMSDAIIYEQPFNEIVRTCLRLERVFADIENSIAKDNSFDYRITIRSLTDAISILDRPDFKGKLTQELLRYRISFNDLKNHKEINSARLETFISELEKHIEYLNSVTGKLIEPLKKNNFLTNIRHNFQKSGGNCDFDMPNYLYWLTHRNINRREELKTWFAILNPIKNLINFVLASIRNSIDFEQAEAHAGSYQQSLEANLPYQLLRIELEQSTLAFPEMSVGRQRFSICFRRPSTTEHTEQLKETISFRIACCRL